MSAGASRSRSRARRSTARSASFARPWSEASPRLALGLLVLAALQAIYGLWPLRRVRREVAAIRGGMQTRIAENFPREVEPLVDEINELLAHSEAQAEEARRHAGNLAHALKTPLTVITNAATAHSADLNDTVIREAAVMRRQVDHHLARARAIGRRASAQARATVWESVEAVERAVSTLYPDVTIDIAGKQGPRRCGSSGRISTRCSAIWSRMPPNMAMAGCSSRSIRPSNGKVTIQIEDDGPGIAEAERDEIFTRGKRLDTTGKPGTGLGLAIVRDVAEIYGGTDRARRERGSGRAAGHPVAARSAASIHRLTIHRKMAWQHRMRALAYAG